MSFHASAAGFAASASPIIILMAEARLAFESVFNGFSQSYF